MNYIDEFIFFLFLMSYGNGGGGVVIVDCFYFCYIEFFFSLCYSYSFRVSYYRIYVYSLGRGYIGYIEYFVIYKSICCKG